MKATKLEERDRRKERRFLRETASVNVYAPNNASCYFSERTSARKGTQCPLARCNRMQSHDGARASKIAEQTLDRPCSDLPSRRRLIVLNRRCTGVQLARRRGTRHKAWECKRESHWNADKSTVIHERSRPRAIVWMPGL